MNIDVSGHEVFYELVGNGRPLMLMHGGGGLDHTSFRPWLDPLGERARLVFYDQHGNGRSERPASYDGVTHQTWIDEADALRQKLGFDRIILLGHSYGGFLAQEYALKYQQHLDGLILVGTAAALDYAADAMAEVQTRTTPEQMAAVMDLFGGGINDDETLGRVWRAALPPYFANYDAQVVDRAMAETRFSAAVANHQMGVLAATYNVSERLPEVDVPTLIVNGRHDWITPPAASQRLLDLLPNATQATFENSGHFPFIEEQAAFIARVGAWIDAL